MAFAGSELSAGKAKSMAFAGCALSAGTSKSVDCLRVNQNQGFFLTYQSKSVV